MTQTELLIDLDALRNAKTLMNHKFTKIIGYYFEDTETYIHAIDEGLSKKDAGLIVPAAHTIKSSSKQLGATPLSEIAFEIEAQAKDVLRNQQDISTLSEKISLLKDTYKRTRLQLEAALQEAL